MLNDDYLQSLRDDLVQEITNNKLFQERKITGKTEARVQDITLRQESSENMVYRLVVEGIPVYMDNIGGGNKIVLESTEIAFEMDHNITMLAEDLFQEITKTLNNK